MTDSYLEVLSLVERLHRHVLEVVKRELDRLRIYDLNSVQAMMLFNIGDAEMTVGELTVRGCYLGANASYNFKKLVENGYLLPDRSIHDRRSIYVRLSPKGRELCRALSDMHERHFEALQEARITEGDLAGLVSKLRLLERFWTHPGELALPPGQAAA